MGEIGYNRHEFLYDLKQWEIILIIRGYRRRQRTFCDMTRWQTWLMMSTQVDLSAKGITSSEGLIRFPWDKPSEDEEDKDTPPPMSADDIARLRKNMREYNERQQKREAQ